MIKNNITLLMVFFVEVMRDGGRDQTTLRLWFSFRINTCKTKIIMFNTIKFITILKLVRDF